MKYDVFISYSSHDQKIAEGICGFLESHGFRCFVAYRDILPGVVWARAITEAMDDSRLMVVVFSDEFNGSEQTDREIEMASENKMPIIPYRITGANLTGAKKYYLKNINWIDAFPNPEDYFGKLLESVKRLVPKDTLNLDIDWPDTQSMSDNLGKIKGKDASEINSPEQNIAFNSCESEENDIFTASIPIPNGVNFDALASKLKESCPNWNKDWEIKMQGDGFRLQRKGKTGAIEVGFWEGHYYIQAEYEGFSDFAKAQKRKYGGRRSYGTWWCHITENGFYEIKQGEMLSNLTQNESMQKIMSNWIDILIKDIDSFEPYANWWQALKTEGTIDKYSQNWSFWIWAEEDTNAFKCLVCDFENAEYGRPFLDTYKINGENRIVIVLWNREDKEEFTVKLLERIKDMISSSESIDGNRRVLCSLPINDSDDQKVAKKISQIIERINKI